MRSPDEKVNTEAFRDTYVNGQRTAYCGLRTGYKTRTWYKMRTADWWKNCANLFKVR